VLIREMRVEEASTVRDLWNEMCEVADARVPGGWGRLDESSLALIAGNLARTPAHPDALCLVVEEEDDLVGFVTASVQGHPTSPGITGEVEELYVRDGDAATERELATRAIDWAFERGANAVVAYEGSGAPWTDASIEFWRTLGFDIDRVVLHRYR